MNTTKPTSVWYSTEVDVEVDIPASVLEEEGWVYMGKNARPTTEQATDIVRRWHDDNHTGVWIWCDHELCREFR